MEELEQPSGGVSDELSIWQRIRRFFWLTLAEEAEERERRIHELTLMIEVYPDAPMNYVLRGELYLEQKVYDLAAADFQKAYDLASQTVETEDWALVAQAAQDRALRGLELAKKHWPSP